MGKEKYIRKVEELFRKSPVVDFSSIMRIVKYRKNIKQYTKQLIRNLLLKGKIKRLTKGYYTQYDEIGLSVFCFNPAYLGLQNAMSFHNLWEQETIPVILTVKKIRPGIREVMGNNVLIRRLDKKYIFGFEYYKDGDFYLPYSDIEKTFIDMVYFRQPLDKENIREFKKKIDEKKLTLYLKKYPKRLQKMVLKILG